jgi:hypothetical protein
MDRLQREKEAEAALLDPPVSADDAEDNTLSPEGAAVYQGGMLRIRRSLFHHVVVSCDPSEEISAAVNKKTKIVRATKKRFDADGQIVRGDSAPSALSTSAPGDESANRDNGSTNPKDSTSAPTGGGKRVGFGFGMSASQGKVDCCVDGTVEALASSKRKRNMEDLLQSKATRNETEEYYEFGELFDSSLETANEAAHQVPSLTEEDVTEAALEAERRRLMAAYFQFKDSKKTGAGQPESESIGKDDVRVRKEFPPSKPTKSSSWADVSITRYDPSSAQADQYLTRQESATDINGDETALVGATADMSAAGGDLQERDGAYADLDVLKDIFRKDVSSNQL